MIEVNFKWTLEEALLASKYVNYSVRKSSRFFPFLIILLVCCSVAAISVVEDEPVLVTGLLVIALVIPFRYFVVVPLYVKRDFKTYPLADKGITLRFTEEGMDFSTSLSTGQSEWGIFSKLDEYPKGFILMHATRLGQWVPKHAFANGQDIEAFRELLARKVPKEK